MIFGEFSSRGELLFEIGLIGADGETIPVKALLDTGFTGWMAIDYQQAESLDWPLEDQLRTMQTAGGEADFNVYTGTVLLDGQCYEVPVLGKDEFPDVLLGLPWLRERRLVVDFPIEVLILG